MVLWKIVKQHSNLKKYQDSVRNGGPLPSKHFRTGLSLFVNDLPLSCHVEAMPYAWNLCHLHKVPERKDCGDKYIRDSSLLLRAPVYLQFREDIKEVKTKVLQTDPTLTGVVQITDLEQISNCPEFGAFLRPHPYSFVGPTSYICFVASSNLRSNLSPGSRSKQVLHHHRYFKLSLSIIEIFLQTLSSLSAFPVCMGGTNTTGHACQNPRSDWRHDLFNQPLLLVVPLRSLPSSPFPQPLPWSVPFVLFLLSFQHQPPKQNCYSNLASWPASSTPLLWESFKIENPSIKPLYISR